jgi:hypothetical protein
VAEGIAELAPFMNAARRLWGDVAGNAARKAELFEESLQALGVVGDVMK